MHVRASEPPNPRRGQSGRATRRDVVTGTAETPPDCPERHAAPAESRYDPATVPDECLYVEGHQQAAGRLDRLAGDVDLLSTLRRTGFSGPDYTIFATELAKYGIAVIGSWIRSRAIFARCKEKGWGLPPPPPTSSLDEPDTVEELTNETVAKALKHFREDVLLPDRWDPRGGASIRTFFIGQCPLRFGNIYRAWRTAELKSAAIPASPFDMEDLAQGRIASAEDEVITAQLAMDALRAVRNPIVRRALAMSAAGYSQREIADRLMVTTKTVERMLANERARARTRSKRGTG